MPIELRARNSKSSSFVLVCLGGGKCGSTSLAILLKHNMSSMGQFDPSSGFADGGKEPCWALTSGGERELYNKFPQCKSPRCTSRRDEVNSGETRSHQEKTVVLDGCPRYTKVRANSNYTMPKQ